MIVSLSWPMTRLSVLPAFAESKRIFRETMPAVIAEANKLRNVPGFPKIVRYRITVLLT